LDADDEADIQRPSCPASGLSVHRFSSGKLQLKDAIGETETRIDPFICTDGKWASFAGVIE